MSHTFYALLLTNFSSFTKEKNHGEKKNLQGWFNTHPYYIEYVPEHGPIDRFRGIPKDQKLKFAKCGLKWQCQTLFYMILNTVQAVNMLWKKSPYSWWRKLPQASFKNRTVMPDFKLRSLPLTPKPKNQQRTHAEQQNTV